MWQQETPENEMTWYNAIEYCKNLNLGGHTDWRLPTIQELLNLLEYTKFNPAINEEYFPNTILDFYWSSTDYVYPKYYAWGVRFDYGNNSVADKGCSQYVRAVRERIKKVRRKKNT
jgi:hypothetical protein